MFSVFIDTVLVRIDMIFKFAPTYNNRKIFVDRATWINIYGWIIGQIEQNKLSDNIIAYTVALDYIEIYNDSDEGFITFDIEKKLVNEIIHGVKQFINEMRPYISKAN